MGIKVCPCCGYSVDRIDLKLCENPMKLDYLGAGYPLFYNWLKCCIILLIILFLGSGGYNLITNYFGNDCVEPSLAENSSKLWCKKNFVTIFSIANKKSIGKFRNFQIYLNIIPYVLIMIVLMIFRKIQRKVNVVVDINQLTPSDYTVIVKNIPIDLKNFNYADEITKIIEKSGNSYGEKFKVMKVNLIYDVSNLINLDNEINFLILKKQKFLRKNNFDFKHHYIKKFNHRFESLQFKKSLKTEEMKKFYTNFIGIALVSLETEQRIFYFLFI